VFDNEQVRSFHMFFVFFPIDILFLDSKKRIVAVKEHFLPFTFFTPKVAFRYAVEVDAGLAEKRGLRIGTKLFSSQQTL